MLFIVMHKINQEIAAGGPPRQDLVERMGQLIGETIAAGKLHDADGLRGAETRVRLTWDAASQRAVSDGPLKGGNELVAGFIKLRVSTLEDAVRWASRYGEAIGAREVDVGPITEAWDIGVAPKPEAAVPLRVLILHKADEVYEAGVARAPERETKLAALLDEMQRAGVLLGHETLQPSAKGLRLQRAGGKSSWTDGPFAESKELISGYTILKGTSKQEAIDWATRYAEILGDVEVDVREVDVREVDVR